MSHTVYRQADVDGVSVFYREAGPPDAPAICSCRTTAARSDSGWRSRTPPACGRWWFRTPWRTRTGSARCGTPAGCSGRTAPPTRRLPHRRGELPAWQEWLRANQPPLLVAWGRYDPSFLAAEAEAYRRDVPTAEVHLLDAGHFALDEQPDQVAELTRQFLRTSVSLS